MLAVSSFRTTHDFALQTALLVSQMRNPVALPTLLPVNRRGANPVLFFPLTLTRASHRPNFATLKELGHVKAVILFQNFFVMQRRNAFLPDA
eukprot:2814011-Pleurochrysis_carterae.AAC.3